MTKIAAIEESIRHTAHHGPPMAVRVGESLVVNLLEEIEVVLDQAV